MLSRLLLPRLDKQKNILSKPYYWIPVAVIVVTMFFFAWLSSSTSKSVDPCAFRIAKNPGSLPVRLTECVQLENVRTTSALTRGLSGRESLSRDQGMLFMFADSARQCMWMKDMKFSLDMLWLDEQHKIVHIEKDVRPETYPNSFCSPMPAKFVVEVNSGIADEAGLQVGQKLNL